MKSKLLSLLLCLSLLASFVVLFSSCQKNTINFAKEYTVVYGSDMSATATDDVKAFATALQEKANTQINVKAVNCDHELVNEKEYEILVGNINRPESQEVLQSISWHGYAISVAGQKFWLGDAQTASCAFMRGMYGEYLKSDMVQVAHHTGSGSEFNFMS